MNGMALYFVMISFLFTLYGLFDITKQNFKKKYVPFYWIIIVWFIPVLGALLYLVFKPWKIRDRNLQI